MEIEEESEDVEVAEDEEPVRVILTALGCG